MKSAALRRFYEATGFTVMRAAVLINIAALLGIIGLIVVVRPAAHMCLCGESPLSARTGEGLATRQVGEGNDFDGGSR